MQFERYQQTLMIKQFNRARHVTHAKSWVITSRIVLRISTRTSQSLMISKTDLLQQRKKIRKTSIKRCHKQHVTRTTVTLIWAIRKILNDTQNSHERIVSTQSLIVNQKYTMRIVTKVHSLWSRNQRFSTAKHMTRTGWTALRKLFIKQSKKKVNLAKFYEHSLSQQKIFSSKKKIILK